MRFRSALGAVGAAAVLAASLVLGAGTASAATPVLSDAAACSAARAVVQTDEAALHAATDAAARAAALTALQAARAAAQAACAGLGGWDHGNGGHWGGHLPGLLSGRFLDLGGYSLDVCAYPTWSALSVRQAARLARIQAVLGGGDALAYQALLAQAQCGGTIVNVNGLPLSGAYLNLDGLLGVSGLGAVNVCQFASWNAFSGAYLPRLGSRFGVLRGRFGSDPLSVYNQLRLRAACSASQVQIVAPAAVSDPAPAVAPASTVAAAPAADPAPASGSGVVRVYPKGAPDTGDGSLAVIVNG